MPTNNRSHLFTGDGNLRRSKPKERVHPLDGRRMGEAGHQVIADLLEQDLREPTFEQVHAAVVAHQATAGAITHRQSARQRLMTAARSYFTYFVTPAEWTFVGAEVSAPGCQFDLVWLDGTGQYWADEVKAGRTTGHVGMTALTEQVRRQLSGGWSAYGERFGGIRVCLLRAPRRSYLALADGSERPLRTKGQCDAA